MYDKEKELLLRQRVATENPYGMMHWSLFNFEILKDVRKITKFKGDHYESINNIIIVADTETSKTKKNVKDIKGKYIPVNNYVVAWTVSMRLPGGKNDGLNIATIYGNKPSEMTEALSLIQQNLKGDKTFVFFHNMAYDWVFVRKFMFKQFNTPVKQLNTKSHYPVTIEFDNGIILRDSYILAQRSLDKWCKDLGTKHGKKTGKWDYDEIRNQEHEFSQDELDYIEGDTIAGCEAIDYTMEMLEDTLATLPLTATGIPRRDFIRIAKEHRHKSEFLKSALDLSQYKDMNERVYHGGYTHANRNYVNWVINKDIVKELLEEKGIKTTDYTVKCYDFASSYPFCMIAYTFPRGKFEKLDGMTKDDILQTAHKYAYKIEIEWDDIKLKDPSFPFPALQYSKMISCESPVFDNGRILTCKKAIFMCNEIDFQVLCDVYNTTGMKITGVEKAYKQRLPKYFTDYIFKCFVDKTKLKGDNPVNYSISKGRLNSLYGNFVQASIKRNLLEIYETGNYEEDESKSDEELYDKYLDSKSAVLNYQIGCWVTSYAYHNLFELFKCCAIPLYSDTDSCYGLGFDTDKVEVYNDNCKKLIKEAGYGPVTHNGREYWLGVAEHSPEEDTYSEFKTMGCKRYAGRHAYGDKDLKITVAGVPKKLGALCLEDDINNFKHGFIFSGEKTGKKTHCFMYVDDIYTDDNGNEVGDSIDLIPADYNLKCCLYEELNNMENLEDEFVYVETHEE